MKIAFVHDWIVHEGGAEAVLRSLIQSNNFNEGKIFVLFSTHTSFSGAEKKDYSLSALNDSGNLQIITALPKWINNIFVYFNNHNTPIFSRLFDYRNLMFRFPLLCRILRKKIKKYNADTVVISSFAAVKNVVQQQPKINAKRYYQEVSQSQGSSIHIGGGESLEPKTMLYLHSPMQYIRENYEENVGKLKFPIKQLYQFAATYLRPWDTKPRHYDVVTCNSKYTATLAKQLYSIEGQVEYPALDKAFMSEPTVDIPKEYFVFVGRVQRYVREIDRIIHLCNTHKVHLIVIGDGPDMTYAKSLAGPTILFVGHITNTQEKIDIVKHARGIINLAKESFGIATAEALCLGVPVLGYNGGATPELVDETSGILVPKKSDKMLHNSLEKFLTIKWNRQEIAKKAKEKFFQKKTALHDQSAGYISS